MPVEDNTTIRSITLNPDQRESQYVSTNETIHLSNREHINAVEQANRFGSDFNVPISEETARFIQEISPKYLGKGVLLSVDAHQVKDLPPSYTLYTSQILLKSLLVDFAEQDKKLQLKIPFAPDSTNEGYLMFLLTASKDNFWEDYSKLYGPKSNEISFASRVLVEKAINIKNEDKYNHSVVIHEATHATEFDLDPSVAESDNLRRKALGKLMVSNTKNLSKEGEPENRAYKDFHNECFKMSVISEVRAIFNELSYDTEGSEGGTSSARTSLRLLNLLDSLKTSSHGGFCELESSLRNLQKGNLFVVTGASPHQIATAILVLGEDYFDEEIGYPSVDRVLGVNKTGNFDIDTALLTAEIANKVMIATDALSQGEQGFSLSESFYAKIENSLIIRAKKLAKSSDEIIKILDR